MVISSSAFQYGGCLGCLAEKFFQYPRSVKLQRRLPGNIFCALKPEEVRHRTNFLCRNYSKSSHNFMVPCKKSEAECADFEPFLDVLPMKKNTHKKVIVLLNPNAGYRSASKIFYSQVKSMFEHAGFKMAVVETASPGSAKVLASFVDLRLCSDGIICIGGDGLVNEVINGLLSRDDTMKGIPVHIGIVPAGSDNSLVCTVLGTKDPISAALLIIKGGSTPVDVFAVKWIRSGVTHHGMTALYYGFLSDVLELSEKYRRQFGPLRYFVAGFQKFLVLTEYSYELEFLPVACENSGMYAAQTDKWTKTSLTTISGDRHCNSVPVTEKWESREGPFLLILVCNHACKSVHSWSSSVVAPKATHDDRSLDLLLVHGSGRLKLLIFAIALQLHQHLSLPFVEYTKVRSVRIRPAGDTHGWCGIDGELLAADEQSECSLLTGQIRLLGNRY